MITAQQGVDFCKKGLLSKALSICNLREFVSKHEFEFLSFYLSYKQTHFSEAVIDGFLTP